MAEQPEKRNLKISVENFGPIRKGSVELKPLTIFIGPNNTGKSYMALLVYALVRSLAQYRKPLFSNEQTRKLLGKPEYADLRTLFWEKFREGGDIRAKALEPESQRAFFSLFNESLLLMMDNISRGILNYFGANSTTDLVYHATRPRSLSLKWMGHKGVNTILHLVPSVDHRSMQGDWEFSDRELIIPILPLWDTMLQNPLISITPADEQREIITEMLLMASILHFFFRNGFPSGLTDYLPAGRTSLVQSWPGFTSMGLGAAFGSPPGRSPLAPFPTTTRDFLQTLLERVLGPRPTEATEAFRPALDVLHGSILQGEIVVESNEAGFPLLVYRSKSGKLRLPLSRASSMVGELAPLDLWIKHVLSPGDMLIIDEPEAHLHPEAQRQIARVLVRLMRAGVRVLITTHSSTILHQISNHILATQTDEKIREAMGFTGDDMITPEEIGVYLFAPGRGGVRIQPVEVDGEFGISEDEFVRVSQAIGDETFQLTVAKQLDEEQE
jgi:hypothetical protein